MSINISRDFSDVLDQISLSQDDFKNLARFTIRAIGQAVYDNWMQVSAEKLTRTRNIYQQNIEIVELDWDKIELVLRGTFPNQLEEGRPAYDMKPMFASSPKVKLKKRGGWYLTVPFTFGTPGSLPENFSNILPQDIYALIKKAVSAKTQPFSSNKVSAQGLLAAQLKGRYGPKTRFAFTSVDTKQTFPAYRHKASIYAGLQRQEKTYAGATQGQYKSFRRVSDKSDPYAWIHPGLQKLALADLAVSRTDVDLISDNAIQTFINQI